MKNKKILSGFILLFILLLNQSAFSVVSKTGTAVAQFLKIGVGPRATALAGSFVALANDASSLYWNPAGAAWIEQRRFFAAHTQWFADLDHEFLGFVMPFASSAVGISFTALNAPEMEQTTIDEPDGTGIYFDVQDIAIGLTYSRFMTDRFSFGITAKFIQQTLFNESARTMAVDIGGILRTGFKGMRLGIVMNNFGGKLKLDGRDLLVSYDDDPDLSGNPLTPAKLQTQSWPLPTSFRIGLAVDIIGMREGFFLQQAQRLTLLIDGYHVNDADETVSMGMEYGWNENFFLRGGYRINHDLEGFSAGAGVRIPIQRWMIAADYSLTDMGDLGTIQRISVGIGF